MASAVAPVARMGAHTMSRARTPPAHASCDSDEGDATTSGNHHHHQSRRGDGKSLGLREGAREEDEDEDEEDDDARGGGVVKIVDAGAMASTVRCAVEYAMQATGTGGKATTTKTRGAAREITRGRATEATDAVGLPGRTVRREVRVQDVPCDVSVALPSDDSAYIRYKDMFGAEKKFAKSSTRARAAQADMYVQDYLERNVYGYAHARVRKSKGRGRGIRKEIVMERTAVGAGRPEDVLDFEGEPERRLAAPPTQSLPATFAVARGIKSGNATAHKSTRLQKTACTNVGAQKEDSKKRRADVISDSVKPLTRSKKPPPIVSRDAKPTAQPRAEPIVPDTIFDDDNWVDEDFMFWDTLIDTPEGQRRKVPRRDNAAQAQAQAHADASPAPDIEDVVADAPPPAPSRDRTQSPEAPASPSAQTGETPSPTNRDELIEANVLDAVERRLAVLETRLFHTEREDADAWRTAFTPGAPQQPPPSGVQAGVPSVPTPTVPDPKPPALRRAHSQLSLEEERAHDRGGFEAVNAPRLPLSGDGRDDTARGHATRDGKRHVSQKSSGQTTDGEQQRREHRGEMSSLASSRALAELERLHEIVESLQRRQESMEHEREKELAQLARAHRDHTAKLESIIAAYESDVDRYSPRLAPNSTSSLRSSPYTPRDRYGAYATPRHHYAGMDPRHDEGDRYASRHHHHYTRGGGASAPPAAEAAALEREIAIMERAIARKNDVISSLSREFVQSGTRWDRFD